MQVKIHELAAKEPVCIPSVCKPPGRFDEVIEWYELQSKGLGRLFKKSVIEHIIKIKKNPEWFLLEADNIHKAYIPKFPFKILFTIENKNTVTIWAIAHMHRKPWYWQKRMGYIIISFILAPILRSSEGVPLGESFGQPSNCKVPFDCNIFFLLNSPVIK